MKEKTVAEIAAAHGGFDPRLAISFMGKAGHGGFLGMDYVGHGEDWVELAIDWREDLVGDPNTGVLASTVPSATLERSIRPKPRWA